MNLEQALVELTQALKAEILSEIQASVNSVPDSDGDNSVPDSDGGNIDLAEYEAHPEKLPAIDERPIPLDPPKRRSSAEVKYDKSPDDPEIKKAYFEHKIKFIDTCVKKLSNAPEGEDKDTTLAMYDIERNWYAGKLAKLDASEAIDSSTPAPTPSADSSTPAPTPSADPRMVCDPDSDYHGWVLNNNTIDSTISVDDMYKVGWSNEMMASQQAIVPPATPTSPPMPTPNQMSKEEFVAKFSALLMSKPMDQVSGVIDQYGGDVQLVKPEHYAEVLSQLEAINE